MKYNWKKGKDLHLADIHSRAFLLEVNACEFSRELEEIDHRPWMSVRDRGDFAVSQKRSSKRGWPDIKADVHLNFDIREELTVREELIFKC